MKLNHFFISTLILLLLGFSLVSANRGSMVLNPYAHLEESGQHAIVAWNGTEEILILSTDMKSSQSTLVLEVIPLPSNPVKVEEGSAESFETLAEIINKKIREIQKGLARGEPVEVTFHAQIGAHDVTVVRVNDVVYFIEWVNDFSRKMGVEPLKLPSDFKKTVSHYVDKDIKYFVFDVIDTKESTQTVNPLMYKFKSSYLYYPLEITATSDVGWSSSRVSIFLITGGIVDEAVLRDIGLYPKIGFGKYIIELTEDELEAVNPELKDFFEWDAFVMNVYYSGPLHVLTKDLVVYQRDISVPIDHTNFVIVSGIIFLFLVAIVYRKSRK
ncbi:MAG: DUF2330 domain-containing protein [Theionarchaea archaeon]|nr:DUF2330 domain-containing protein [Theionarchaea archaeon]